MLEYLINIFILIAIYGILALSLNLVIGYTGLLSLAHAGFYGIGAYAFALGTTQYNLNFFTAMLCGIFLAFLVAGIFGIILSTLKTDIYSLASLGLGVIVFSVFLNWQNVTQGPLGIAGIPRPEIGSLSLNSNTNFLIFSWIGLAIIYFICRYLVNAPFGRTLKAIREHEEVTQVFGYQTLFFKLAVFMISASMASFAGSLFASYISFIDPSNFTLNEGIFITVIIIVGGLASLSGSLLGAALLILLPEALRFVGMPPEFAAQARQFIYGLILILLMIYRPTGFLGKFKM
jgi:branched-chain amino acid transport system permease protein